jgi:hypothetical protein
MSGLTAETKLGMSRAKLVLTSFTLYQCGSLGTAIFYLILIAGYKNQVEANLWNLQYVWRLMLSVKAHYHLAVNAPVLTATVVSV